MSTTTAPTETPAPRSQRAPTRPTGMADSFPAALDRGPLVLDSGMGARLCARGLDVRVDDPCLWSLARPRDVLDLHLRDAEAGCRVFFTNTFGANRDGLGRFGRCRDIEAINRAAAALARQAAGPRGFVAGDIGPSAAGPGAAAEQAAALIDAGVDVLVFETFLVESLEPVLRDVRATLGSTLRIPLIASLWRWPDPPGDAARRLVDAGAAAIGINCLPVISATPALAARLGRAVACPIMVKAGIPPGATDADSAPAAFAAAVPRLVEQNVRLIGGCCGTTDSHVAAVAAACSPLPSRDPAPPGGTAT